MHAHEYTMGASNGFSGFPVPVHRRKVVPCPITATPSSSATSSSPITATLPAPWLWPAASTTLGYDLIGIQDHPYQANHFDALALIGVILGQTERVRLFPDVANLPLRPPAVLAKHAAALDQLSGGRFDLGLGAGAFWDGIKAMGGPVRSPGEAVASLEEAIQIIRGMWSDARGLRFEGEHYQVVGARPGPRPAHDRRRDALSRPGIVAATVRS